MKFRAITLDPPWVYERTGGQARGQRTILTHGLG